MENKLDNFVSWLGESKPIRAINFIGGMSHVYDTEPINEFEEHLENVGLDAEGIEAR